MQRALIPFALVSALGACVATNGDEGMFLTKNVAPNAGCTFMADSNEAFIPHGELSVLSSGAYQFHPQLTSRVTAEDTMIDQRTIILKGARVDITFPDESVFSTAEQAQLVKDGLTHFQSLFSGPLAPNGGITDAGFDLVPRSLVDKIVSTKGVSLNGSPGFRTELITKIVVYGDLSGSEVTSQEFQYPVTLCNNCIINVLGGCPLDMGTVVTNLGNACNRYQDGVVDCCAGAGGAPVCPPTVKTM